jgi:hypothetical protein
VVKIASVLGTQGLGSKRVEFKATEGKDEKLSGIIISVTTPQSSFPS